MGRGKGIPNSVVEKKLYAHKKYDRVPAGWTPEQAQVAAAATKVALASPSAVKVWSERVGITTYAACIGETSAEACRTAGFAKIYWPESPGIEGWAKSVAHQA